MKLELEIKGTTGGSLILEGRLDNPEVKKIFDMIIKIIEKEYPEEQSP